MTQTDPINWRLALLTQNPFPKIPPSHPEGVVWAGFPALKKQLDTVFAETFSFSRTQVLLIGGARGSGKTHAATFYGRKEYLTQFEAQDLVPPFGVISVKTPTDIDKGDILLYQRIIEALHFNTIRAIMRSTIIELGSEAALAKLQELARSEPLGKALWLLGHQKTRSGQLTLFQDEDIGSNHHKLLERYFYSQNIKSELKRLDLARSINTTQDRFQLLVAIFQCFIGLSNGNNSNGHRRFILWIDNTEDLIHYHPNYYYPFVQGLQDLIDYLPHHFTLLMNFILAPYETSHSIKMVLGRALTGRITQQIYCQEPSKDEAFEYVKDLMRQYRTESFEPSGLPATYPFHEAALRLLIANLPPSTPRDINQCCAYIIGEALKQGIIHGAGEGAIDMQCAQRLADEYNKSDMGRYSL